ncbi:MAG: ABC transporter permease, partial [Phycisphaerae bacterium]
EMLINTWLQEDLAARPGDEIDVRYYVMSAGRSLIERTHRFRVRGIVPMAGLAADADLMPDYPGFADAENCRDWEPGVPIDLDRIRDKDERYWDEHRGTPKAFINLATGRRLWGNRFGELTAIRYPAGTDTRDRIASAFRDRLDPAAVGFSFQPVRERALAAGGQGLDFGQLFLGFSFFLIAAALLLAGLLFALSVEQRAEEIGTLLALGFRPERVRRLMLLEGGVLAIAGACVGTAVGALYTRAILYGLGTLWRGALGVSSLQYHAEPATLAIGFSAGVLTALATLALSVRRCARRPAATLLSGSAVTDPTAVSTRGSRLGRAVAWPAFGLSAVILAHNAWRGERSSAGAFFAVGGLLLIGGLGLAHALLAARGRTDRPERITLTRLASRNAARRRGRSLATLGMLACGSFLLVAVGANRHGPPDEPDRRSSGTGGFALFAEATLPIPHDLNTAAGRDAYGLTAEQLEGVSIVSFRVREGDDASCLNPQRAQVPRLLGVDPAALQSRGAFTFVKTAAGQSDRGWNLLSRAATASGDTVPAIGDEATVTWGLHKKVGDLIPLADEQGRSFS